MNILMIILALLCLGGDLPPSQAQGKGEQDENEMRGLSDSELSQVRARLPCLKPGMKMKEVFDVLGVDVPKRAFISWGGGPADNYGTVYQLAPSSSEHGYNLLVVTDRESKFKSAGIACWLHANKCAEDNEKAKDNPKDCPDNTKKQDQ